MICDFIKERVDIYALPIVKDSHRIKPDIQLTVGDLHGNAMKLMFILTKHGIATNIDNASYQRLVKIYKIPIDQLTLNDLTEFDDILSQIIFRSESLIRLVGDELADRGSNDYFTLKILEKLYQHKVPVEIMLSNHGNEFITACEKNTSFSVLSSIKLPSLAQSMINLQALVDNKLIVKEDVLTIVNQYYKPTLKAISYSLTQDRQDITIYSHAAIGLDTIKALAEKLNLTYNDLTIDALTETIDSINTTFQTYVQRNKIYTLIDSDKIKTIFHSPLKSSDGPFEFIMWNRTYSLAYLFRPMTHAGYNVHYVHGHDSNDPSKTKANVYNLNDVLGKSLSSNQHDYKALYSQIIMVEKVKDINKDNFGQETITMPVEVMDNENKELSNRKRKQTSDDSIITVSKRFFPAQNSINSSEEISNVDNLAPNH